MDATEYVQGVRDFADWVEQNADLFAEHELAGDSMRMLLYCTSREKFAERASRIGFPSDEDKLEISGGDYFTVSRHFGPIEIHLYTAGEIVCDKVIETVEQTRWIFDHSVIAPPEKHVSQKTDAELEDGVYAFTEDRPVQS